MKSLLIDTSGQNALLAITIKGEVSFSSILAGAKNLSLTLFPALESLLKQGRLKIQDLNYIGVGIGPGSYMGIRTAASIANTLSFCTHAPLVEFLSPFAFLPEKEGNFTYVGDGKMGKLFILKGRKTGNVITHIQGPTLLEKNDASLHFGTPDFLVNEGHPPNLEWLSQYVHQLYLHGKTSPSFQAELAYLH